MEQKKKNLLKTYKAYIIVPALILAIVLVVSIIMMILYANTGYIAFIIVFSVVGTLTVGAYIISYLHLSKKLKQVYYKQLYETTYTNINKIKNVMQVERDNN